MNATGWHGREDVRVDDVPDPHRQPLTTVPAAHEMFRKKQDGCLKVVLGP